MSEAVQHATLRRSCFAVSLAAEFCPALRLKFLQAPSVMLNLEVFVGLQQTRLCPCLSFRAHRSSSAFPSVRIRSMQGGLC